MVGWWTVSINLGCWYCLTAINADQHWHVHTRSSSSIPPMTKVRAWASQGRSWQTALTHDLQATIMEHGPCSFPSRLGNTFGMHRLRKKLIMMIRTVFKGLSSINLWSSIMSNMLSLAGIDELDRIEQGQGLGENIICYDNDNRGVRFPRFWRTQPTISFWSSGYAYWILPGTKGPYI